jgi:hypothetical protein
VNVLLQPWQLLLFVLAGWVNRRQQAVVEYLLAENRVLRKKIGNKRVLLTDEQRRHLAVKSRILGRKLLEEFASIASPETILRWHRDWRPDTGIIAIDARRQVVKELIPHIDASLPHNRGPGSSRYGGAFNGQRANPPDHPDTPRYAFLHRRLQPSAPQQLQH